MRAPTALTIAGSDSGGGAGIQADLKTFLALGVHGTSAITALTAQNTTSISAILPVPPEFVHEQIKQVATDFEVAATKTGMLGSAEVVEAVCWAVKQFGLTNLVVDPVLESSNHRRLLSRDGADAMSSDLFSLATLATPNLAEAADLTGLEVSSIDQMREAAKALHDMGTAYVLVKGGHLEGDAVDVLFDGSDFVEFRAERIVSKNTHGTGCTLSAAIAAYLARGLMVPQAVEQAKIFVTGVIRNGSGPANHG